MEEEKQKKQPSVVAATVEKVEKLAAAAAVEKEEEICSMQKKLPSQDKFSVLMAAVEDAEQKLSKVQSWRCTKLVVEFASSVSDDTPQMVNVMDTLGKTSRMSKKKRNKAENKLWLPSMFNTNTEQFRNEEVAPHFGKVATSVGFAIRSRGWDGTRNHL